MPHALDQSFGALLIGLQFSACLFGFLSLQSYLYYRKFYQDPVVLKCVVGALWVLTTTHLAFISHAEYFYLVTSYANGPVENDVAIWSLFLHIATTAVVISIVQCFFAERIWTLSEHKIYLVVPLVPLIVAKLVVGIGTTVVTIRAGVFSNMVHCRHWITACFVSVIPPDVIICAAMAYYLRQSREGLAKPENIFRTITYYVLNTPLLPSLLSFSILISYLSLQYSSNLSYLAAHFVVGQLYASSMLIHLNSRAARYGVGDHGLLHTVTGYETEFDTDPGNLTRNTFITDSTQVSSRQFTRVDTDSLVSLEYRRPRPRSPSTPTFNASERSMEIEPAPLMRTLSPLVEEPGSGQEPSIKSVNESATTHMTGPTISWHSVQSTPSPLLNYDLGDLESRRDPLLLERWQDAQITQYDT